MSKEIALATIAAKLKVHPRVARARLRRAQREHKAPENFGGFNWKFLARDVPKVREIIRG